MYLSRFILVTALFAFAAGHQAAAQQATEKEIKLGTNAFTIGDPVPSWVDRAALPEVTQTQPIVVRLADGQYLADRVPVVYVRRATQINNAASLTAAGRVSISFAPEYEHVQLHAIRIERGQEQLDRTTTSNIRFLQREQGLDNGIYSGRVTASILIDDLRVGDTLDIEYSTFGENPVFGGKFIGVAGWDQIYPTLRRRVVLNHPVDRHPTWRVVGDRAAAAITPKETIQNGVRRLEFDQPALPGTPVEALTSPDFFTFRFIQFSEFGTWNDVAHWATDLFEGKPDITDDLRAAVERIRALGSDEARAVSALEFVQTQIRYFSVSLGESSHRPSPPDAVLRRRYGDCKDKSLLLITMLRELGIESKPVLLQMGRRAGLDKTLPSPQFFNHVIVQAVVGGKTYFLDPTRLGQHGQLDRMGQMHEGAQILVVARDTTALSQIPAGNADVIADEVSERGTLARFGEPGQLDVRHVWHGVRAEGLRLLFERAPREQVIKIVGDGMERRYPGASLAGDPSIKDDRASNEFSISASYKIPKLATEIDGNWVVAFAPDNLQNVLTGSSSANRTTPLRIPGFPFHGKYQFEMVFPEQVSASIDPREQAIANNSFSATVTDYFRGNVARKSIDLKTLRASVETSDYPGFAEDFRSLNKAIGNGFSVNKAFFDARVAGAANADLAHRLQDQALETIKKTTETIDGGKLAGADLANVYCLRGGAQANLGRQEEALQDVNNAVRIAPNAVSLSCRAETYNRFGQFEKSIADHTDAIALGSATNGLVFRARGISRVYAGHLAEANADFAKATELSDKETRIYSEMWLVATSGQLHKPIPAELAARAAAEAGGEWPRAGLAMLIGKLSPDDMLKSLEKKQGDERQMALAEAYFYLGQYYLLAGDRAKAQESFEKTRSLGVINYLEHTSAEFELERLKKPNTAAAVKPNTAAAIKPNTAAVAKPSVAAPPKPNTAAPPKPSAAAPPKPNTATSAKLPSAQRAVAQ
jgi:lipoprotein NlpI/transglutaminase-like putative cysteine protease